MFVTQLDRGPCCIYWCSFPDPFSQLVRGCRFRKRCYYFIPFSLRCCRCSARHTLSSLVPNIFRRSCNCPLVDQVHRLLVHDSFHLDTKTSGHTVGRRRSRVTGQLPCNFLSGSSIWCFARDSQDPTYGRSKIPRISL
jgi:hypothetical protein